MFGAGGDPSWACFSKCFVAGIAVPAASLIHTAPCCENRGTGLRTGLRAVGVADSDFASCSWAAACCVLGVLHVQLIVHLVTLQVPVARPNLSPARPSAQPSQASVMCRDSKKGSASTISPDNALSPAEPVLQPNSVKQGKGLWTRCEKCGVILYIKHLKARGPMQHRQAGRSGQIRALTCYRKTHHRSTTISALAATTISR